jgi:hypothetical protein
MSETENENATEELIQLIMRQTTYTKEEAREKLADFQYDAILVIKDFMGIKPKEEKPSSVHVKSLNQEIYKQIRIRMDESMKKFNEKQQFK